MFDFCFHEAAEIFWEIEIADELLHEIEQQIQLFSDFAWISTVSAKLKATIG